MLEKSGRFSGAFSSDSEPDSPSQPSERIPRSSVCSSDFSTSLGFVTPPSTMDTDYESRMAALEAQFAEFRLAHESANRVSSQDMAELKQMLQGLRPNADAGTSHPLSAPDQQSVPLVIPETRDPPRSRLKASPPSEFDGDRKFGRHFVNQCRLYMSLSPDLFPNDQIRIAWVLSFMKSGRAAAFAARVLRWESDNPGSSRFRDWSTFEATLKSEFCELYEDVHARNRLETSDYHQGRRTVDEYIDEFDDLVDRAGYSLSTDGSNVMRFRRGLSPEIQDCIAELGATRPAETDLKGWYYQARLFAQHREANAAFKSGSRNASSASRSAPSLPKRTTTTPVFAPPPPPHPAPKPLSQGVPMDVDAARQRSLTPKVCFRCQQEGHVRAQCPRRFDVRALDSGRASALAAALAAGRTAEEVIAEWEDEDLESESDAQQGFPVGSE